MPIYTVLYRKYYLDEFYEDFITRKIFYGIFAKILDWIDKSIIDGVVRTTGYIFGNAGRPIAHLQTGQLQGYGITASIGVIVIFAIVLLVR